MLIPRAIVATLRDLGFFFPVISLTGPRQAGKTTILRELYPNYAYVSLENPDVLEQATAAPRKFLATYDDQCIFDEAQRFPELFSYLQEIVDNDRRPGRFILSGSQNFLLRKSISQSLAGRVGVAKLLPLDLSELRSAGLLPESPWEAVFYGGYPELIEKEYNPTRFFDSYLQTYLQCDVTELVKFSNLTSFRRFLRACAAYAGQAVNMSNLAKDADISVNTVKSWLGILEQSFITFRLEPFYRNLGKQLSKTPKLYFYDTGFACYLLGLQNASELELYGRKGALFENLIVADAHKSYLHQGRPLAFTFYRDKSGAEIDLVHERALKAEFWEIKSSGKTTNAQTEYLDKVAAAWDRPTEQKLVYVGEEEGLRGKTTYINWRNINW